MLATRRNAAVVIEVADEDVGLAVRERRGFRFVAADPRYHSLDGRWFDRLAQLERAARLLRGAGA